MDITVCEDCGNRPGLISAGRGRCAKCGGNLKKQPLITQTAPVAEVPCSARVISDVATLEIINTAIGTATSIINMSDNKHVQDMAANIADSLIALTGVESL